MDTPDILKIKRKPVPTAIPTLAPPLWEPDNKLHLKISTRSLKDQYLQNASHHNEEGAPPLPIRRRDSLPLVADPDELPPAFSAPLSPDGVLTPITPTTPDPSTKDKPIWKTALTETRYLVGGLISHPHESTQHYTILRHSPGLIFYRGHTTSVEITIFSSSSLEIPVPANRTLLLQRRGYSGDTGMNLKNLMGPGTDCLDVTPALRATAQDVSESDERAWQRDIGKFLKRAATERSIKSHVPRETHVIRIPATAADGYFRLLLCASKSRSTTEGGSDSNSKQSKRKVLCHSPVFRIASTSTDASILRGASLRTMPLEMGIKVASTIGNKVVMRYVPPVAGTIQSRIDKHKPAMVAQGQKVYSRSGLSTKFDALTVQAGQSRERRYDPIEHLEEIPFHVVGSEEGPEPPFPIKFSAKVVRGTGRGGQELGILTANLADVPNEVEFGLRGVYLGWACVIPKKTPDGTPYEWHKSIISVGPSPYASPTVVSKTIAAVHLMQDFGAATFFDAKVKVIIMGFLRPMKPSTCSKDEILETVDRDTLITFASLSRENWGHNMAIDKIRTVRSERSLSEKYVEAREKVQRRVDSIPLHLAGVRTMDVERRDKAYGNGGLWIPR